MINILTIRASQNGTNTPIVKTLEWYFQFLFVNYSYQQVGVYWGSFVDENGNPVKLIPDDFPQVKTLLQNGGKMKIIYYGTYFQIMTYDPTGTLADDLLTDDLIQVPVPCVCDCEEKK